MNEFFQTSRCVFLVAFIVLCSCSGQSIKERHLEIDGSKYYPLAVVSANSKTQISGYTSRAMTGKCIVGTLVFTYGLLTPLCAPVLAADVIDDSRRYALHKSFLLKVESLEPRFEALSNPTLLRSHAMEYLLKHGANAHDVTKEAFTSGDVERYQALQEQGYPMILELSLLSLRLDGGLAHGRKKEGELFCLFVHIQGRIITTDNNQQIAIKEDRGITCYPLDKWLLDDVLEEEISKLYSTSSRYILDEIILIYKKSESETLVLSPIIPKILIEQKWSDKQREELIETPRGKPEYLKDFTPFADLQFTDVSTEPRFEWSSFNGPGVTDVRYEFRIYQGKPKAAAEIQKMFSLEFYPSLLYVFPEKVVYSHDNLLNVSHKPNISLDSCSWYFWTVRANFQLYGNPRVTDWSEFKHPSSWKKSFFPIRTPASDGDPSCWEQAVDWGPL